MSSTASKGAYVPPHLRNRSQPNSSSSTSASSSSSSRSNYTPSSPSSQRNHPSAPTRTYNNSSRTPWSPSSNPTSTHPGRNHFMNVSSPNSKYSYGSAFTSGPEPSNRSNSTRTNDRDVGNTNTYSSSPSLYVFGDSFVGPFKLLREDCVRVQTFKGSSAKGLNNPNSIKQVSRDLLPAINSLLAPPPYAYMPSAGRWVMLIFGNVDLQINYLWQLANKPISHLSFPPSSTTSPNTLNNDNDEDEFSEDESPNDKLRSRRPSNVLATATETSSRGPALGPELFVESVVKAYTTWLEREIINGPIGKRLIELSEQRKNQNNENTTSSPNTFRRKTAPPSKVLIAAALPPLVEDELLPRIPEKYVERLEEDHEKAQKAFDRLNVQEEKGSRTPWAKNGSPSPTQKFSKLGDGELEIGLSTLQVSDNTNSLSSPSSPKSVSSSSSSRGSTSTLFDSQRTSNTSETMVSSIHSSLPGQDTESSSSISSSTKTPIPILLSHSPPLCTLPIRVSMTNRYNTLLREFCEKHPDILSFIDISPSMQKGSEQPSIHGEVDRNVWACPVDPTNVHPLWEPTLPLWKEELLKENLPVEQWRISEDAEETFKAYEIDKRRRTQKRGDQRDVDGNKEEEGEGDEERGERIKLRDE